ncbi:MAG: hypothetical protein AAB865_00780 [Patescibacteria group bacterium]
MRIHPVYLLLAAIVLVIAGGIRQHRLDIETQQAASAAWVANEQARIAKEDHDAEQLDLVALALANAEGGGGEQVLTEIHKIDNEDFKAEFWIIRGQREIQDAALDELMDGEPCVRRFDSVALKRHCDKRFDAIGEETFKPIKPHLERLRTIATELGAVPGF